VRLLLLLLLRRLGLRRRARPAHVVVCRVGQRGGRAGSGLGAHCFELELKLDALLQLETAFAPEQLCCAVGSCSVLTRATRPVALSFGVSTILLKNILFFVGVDGSARRSVASCRPSFILCHGVT